VDSGADAKSSFPCGPGLSCDPTTQYCYHFISSVILLDAAANYACMVLPACDAADPCSCMPPAGSLDTCSCVDTGGDVTRTCSCKVCSVPPGN
jgi:hypothetical protein